MRWPPGWVGPVGVLITLQQYERGYYTAREAATICTNFSVVSVPLRWWSPTPLAWGIISADVCLRHRNRLCLCADHAKTSAIEQVERRILPRRRASGTAGLQ